MLSEQNNDFKRLELFSLTLSMFVGLSILLSPREMPYISLNMAGGVAVCSLYSFISLVKFLTGSSFRQQFAILMLWVINLVLQFYSLSLPT
jgi:hypothetical protein